MYSHANTHPYYHISNCTHTHTNTHTHTDHTSFLHSFKVYHPDFFQIGGKISTDVNKEIKEEKKKKKKKVEEQKRKEENEDLFDSNTLLKKRTSENIENVDDVERKKKKESVDSGETNELKVFKNTEAGNTNITLKTETTAERMTLASLSSDRQSPVLEALTGRLVNIERSRTY